MKSVVTHDEDNDNEEKIAMNVVGNNFALMKVSVLASHNGKRHRKSIGNRKSLGSHRQKSNQLVVSPSLLRALRSEPNRDSLIIDRTGGSTPSK